MIRILQRLAGLLRRRPGPRPTLAQLRRAAERGDVEARYALGEACLAGYGARDIARQAVNWLELAARDGHAQAQHRLSLIYLNGLGASPMIANWLAESRDTRAQANAGLLFPDGAGIAPHPERAFLLAEAAAAQGHAAAQANLGMMLLRGVGCAQDYAAANLWFARAAAQGDPGGDLGLGLICEHGLGRAADPLEAASHYRRAAAAGNDAAATALGLLHVNGRIAGDLRQAERLLAGPAARGNIFAQKGLQRLRDAHASSVLRTVQ
ncbi:MAG: tetratricopeptide repeat protein [Alphaproteobacteria bacterium]